MIIRNERDITGAVFAEVARASDPRFKEIMDAAVRHLHWYSLVHNFVIEPGEAKLPRPPITGKAGGERPQSVILERTDAR